MDKTDDNWTIRKLIHWAEEHLREQKIENARLNAEWLLTHTLSLQRTELYLNHDRIVNQTEFSQFKSYIKRRLNHEPLQYITGKTEFMSLPFIIDERTLIPRPETEQLVEHIIKVVKTNFADESIRILDIGTGSGNIPIALSHYLPDIKCTSVDISEDALSLAKKNAKLNRLGNTIRFQHKNIFSKDFPESYKNPFQIIVSNPPYVAKNELDSLLPEVRDYEPFIALSDDEDGFTFYRRIVDLTSTLLAENGYVFFETGDNQGREVANILKKHNFDVEIYKDYNRVDRIVCGRKVEVNGRSPLL